MRLEALPLEPGSSLENVQAVVAIEPEDIQAPEGFAQLVEEHRHLLRGRTPEQVLAEIRREYARAVPRHRHKRFLGLA